MSSPERRNVVSAESHADGSAPPPAAAPFDAASSPSFAPLIRVPETAESSEPPRDVAESLVNALRDSGFLLVETPLVPPELQAEALEAATAYLERPGSSDSVVSHPTDPKTYAMLQSDEDCRAASPVLARYMAAMERTKTAVLRCIAAGLDLDDDYFASLHRERNDSLRLLRYRAGTAQTGNRCREHSDYGTVTLLLTDGVSGLEAYHRGVWLPVPHVPGSLVVNVGSLMSDWTGGKLLATLHRVAGPASEGSLSAPETLLEAAARPRTSIAFFADPDEDAKATLGTGERGAIEESPRDVSVADYVRWRSGGVDADRSGVAFTPEEERRLRRG